MKTSILLLLLLLGAAIGVYVIWKRKFKTKAKEFSDEFDSGFD